MSKCLIVHFFAELLILRAKESIITTSILAAQTQRPGATTFFLEETRLMLLVFRGMKLLRSL